MKNIDIINNIGLYNIEWINNLRSKSKEIYLVGGGVRDYFLNKKSKDIDILVCGLYYSEIVEILSKYGDIKEVGKNFGIIKFKPINWIGGYIDISIPRTEKKSGNLHRDFDVITNPFIPIEIELNRRDCTLNSIAVSLSGEIIDPFNGLKDIENKLIRATSKKAFSEDPLRMLRAIQFASRFQFKIEEKTFKMISENKSDIKSITGERIIEELDKIFFKGDIQLGLKLFKESGLHNELFQTSMLCDFDVKISTREDFFFSICSTSENFKNILKGDLKTEKGIKAIEKCFELNSIASKSEIRQKLFDAIQISDLILNCDRVPFLFKEVIKEFKEGKFPKSIKELAINGDDLMELGFKGVEIGKQQRFLLSEIFSEKRINIKSDLI